MNIRVLDTLTFYIIDYLFFFLTLYNWSALKFNRMSTPNHLATCSDFVPRQSGSRRFRSWNSLSHCPFPSFSLSVSLLIFSQDVSHTRTWSRIVTRSNGIHPTSSTRSSRVAAYIRAFPCLSRSYIFACDNTLVTRAQSLVISRRVMPINPTQRSHIKIRFISRIARSIFVSTGPRVSDIYLHIYLS